MICGLVQCFIKNQLALYFSEESGFQVRNDASDHSSFLARLVMSEFASMLQASLSWPSLAQTFLLRETGGLHYQ